MSRLVAESQMPARLPVIVAHRGLHHTEPENSIAAFLAAAEARIPWVECDVWPSADGVPMVLHDQTLDRTTAGVGNVNDCTCNQLQKWGVPSLRQLLDAISPYRATAILIEIKPPNAAAFAAEVEKLADDYGSAYVIQSFHPENIKPKPRHALLVESADNLIKAMASAYLSIHAEHSLIDREVVNRLHASGRKIGAWTVNQAADIRRMIDLKIDLLITDEPELAGQIRDATRSDY